MNHEQIEVTFLVIDALESLQITYLIGGSLASGVYGEPRATRDTDILADIKQEHVKKLCTLLKSEFNISSEAIENALRYRSRFNAIHFATLFKIDIFIPKHRAFDEQELRRRALHVVASDPERQAFVASAEDIVLAKLEWYRLGNKLSDQQWRDIGRNFQDKPGTPGR